MSHKGKRKCCPACSIDCRLTNCNHSFTAGETGHRSGISFTSQLMHQTQLLETWQGHYNFPSFPFSYLPVWMRNCPLRSHVFPADTISVTLSRKCNLFSPLFSYNQTIQINCVLGSWESSQVRVKIYIGIRGKYTMLS